MQIKILSWNIWCGTYLEEVIEFLKTANADIVALQEVSEDERGNISEINAKKLGYKHVHAVGMNLPLKFLPWQRSDDERIIKFGNAILSKYKITNSKVIELTEEDKRLIIEADIEVGDKSLHVFSIHLKHTHQKPLELQNLQAENLIKLASKEKTIIMGDFNALPESTVIQKMNQTLQDSEIDSLTPTWSVYKEGCTVCLVGDIKHKLDYIFTSKDIKASSFKVHESKSSDHLPISAVIKL